MRIRLHRLVSFRMPRVLARARAPFAALACVLLLAACQTASFDLAGAFKPATPDDPQATGSVAGEPVPAAGGVATPAEPHLTDLQPPSKSLLGADPYDDLAKGKRAYADGNYGLAEQHFRRATEASVNDAEAWLGLAAAYDRLKRFDLADRAYKNVLRLTGPTPEVLNNIGYSMILRGDYATARVKLAEAQAKDPQNPYVAANIAVLEQAIAKRKSVR